MESKHKKLIVTIEPIKGCNNSSMIYWLPGCNVFFDLSSFVPFGLFLPTVPIQLLQLSLAQIFRFLFRVHPLGQPSEGLVMKLINR